MALHPDVCSKAQAEIDAVVGSDRLPKVTDRAALPYVDALVKEVMRWYPMLPLSTSTTSVGHIGYSDWSRCRSSDGEGRCLRGVLHPQRYSCDAKRLVRFVPILPGLMLRTHHLLQATCLRAECQVPSRAVHSRALSRRRASHEGPGGVGIWVRKEVRHCSLCLAW